MEIFEQTNGNGNRGKWLSFLAY